MQHLESEFIDKLITLGKPGFNPIWLEAVHLKTKLFFKKFTVLFLIDMIGV